MIQKNVEDGVTSEANNWHLTVVARKKTLIETWRSNTPWKIIPPGKRANAEEEEKEQPLASIHKV
jgi:hypothetical protein